MTHRKPADDDRRDGTQEVLEALEHIRYIEKVYADCRAIQRETEELDRKFRRDVRAWACAVPVFAAAGIALLVLTPATGLAVIVLAHTALLAVALAVVLRLNRRIKRVDRADP
jgi:Flp pilus assembly protein TadB